jgi:hypothetical protein
VTARRSASRVLQPHPICFRCFQIDLPLTQTPHNNSPKFYCGSGLQWVFSATENFPVLPLFMQTVWKNQNPKGSKPEQYRIKTTCFGLVAQRLEQATHNRLVLGSNPSEPTIFPRLTSIANAPRCVVAIVFRDTCPPALRATPSTRCCRASARPSPAVRPEMAGRPCLCRLRR